MLAKTLRRLGTAKCTLLLTGISVICSVVLYSIYSIFSGELLVRGVVISGSIPTIVAPPMCYHFLRVLLQLYLSKEDLQSSEERFRDMAESIHEAFWLFDCKEQRVIYVNPAYEEIWGRSIEALYNRYEEWTESIYPEDLEFAEASFARIVQTGGGETREYRIVRPDGSIRWILDREFAVTDENGEVYRIAGIAEDITERKRAEEALRDSELQYRTTLDSMADFIHVVDADMRILLFNATFKESNEDLALKTDVIGRNLFETFPFLRGKVRDEYHWVFENAKTLITEESTEVKGREFITETRKIPILENGKVVKVVTVIRDMTQRKQTEAELKASEDKYRTLVESSSDAILMLDKNRNIVSCNGAFLDLFGYEHNEVEGKSVRIIHPSDESFHSFGTLAYPVITAAGSFRTDWEFKSKKDRIIPVETVTSAIRAPNGAITGYVAILRDTTEKEQLQKQLRQAQKMEAIGTLAGGIAHDFNNILSAIIGYAELSMMDIPEASEAKHNLEEVRNATRRARDLVKQILSFSHQTEQEKKPVQIKPVVKEATKLLRASLPTTIEISQHISPDAGIIVADPTQIHQLMMNLCTNAAHAMEEKGGTLAISLANVDVDSATAALHIGLESRPYLKLTVSDTGDGMTSDVMERIFEPYFSTREKGEGTGMGLAVVHGIVKSHGGTITVDSKLGQGSTFNVYIPQIEKEESPEPELIEVIPPGSERILFVDDEDTLVTLGKKILEKLGYTVTTRTSSIEALELFRAQPDGFDFVITDMTMPNMTGDRLAKELLEIRNDIPILLCTGYSERISKEKANQIGICDFVMKPLEMGNLARTIRNVLDSN